MSDFESKINIDIDAGGALAAIKALQTKISDFHTSLAKGSATANLKSLQMQQTLIDTINSTGQFSAQMKTVASSTQTFTTALEKNKLSMGQYFKYAGGASKSFGRFFRTEMDTIQKVAIERVKDLQTQYVKMGRDANGAIKTIAVRPLALDMKNLSTQTQIAAQKQQLLNQLLKQGSTNLLNFGKNTQWAGRQLMVGFTIPLGIFGATAAKAFMDMEKQAIAFKRVYGDTFTATKETDAMLKQVQQLASEFTKYGVAVEKTMEQAAKAAATGKMGADLLAQVSEATRLSVLGNVEQAQALETTISLTNAFGTAADQLRGKINFLNAVENQTVTSIEDLTIAIPKAAPVIQQLGGDVEDLTFFLTAMREGGINASESANALKSGLASLINPTKKASDFLQGFGININKIVEGNKGNVQGLVVDFAKALDTLDPLNRARAIEQLFGKFQFSRLSTLFQNVIKDGSQAARVLELTRQSSAELGILAQRELNRIAASPMYKFEKAVADFKKELAPVGEEFLKAVTPIINFATDVLKAFNNLDGGVKQFIVNATGLIAGIGPVFLMTFGLLANGVANIIKGFTFVKNVFNKTASASTILGETTDYMTQQQLEAATVAASLEQVHNKLTQAFTSEAQAVANLTAAYQKAVGAQVAFTGPPPAARRSAKPKKYADGVFSVPGPKGAGDVVPAMLSPGEAVIPAKPAAKYSGFIKGMISGKIPGFNKGTPKVGDENLEWDKLTSAEQKSILRSTRSAPDAFKKEKYDLSWATRDAEQKVIMQKLSAAGMTQSQIQKYMDVHVSHLAPEKRRINIGGMAVNASDFRNRNNMTPDLGLVNLFTEYTRKAATQVSAKDLQSAVGKGMTVKQIQEQLDALSRGEHIAATPAGNKVMGALASEISAGRVKAGGVMTKKLASAVSAVSDIRASDKSGKGFLRGIGDRKFSQPTIDKAEKQFMGKMRTAYGIAKKALTDPEYRAALRPNRKKTDVDKESNAAKKRNTTAVNKNTRAVKKDTAEVEKSAKSKSQSNKASTKPKVAATPTVTVTESLGNGVTRTVDSKGKERFKVNGRFASPQQAQAAMSASGAGTKPGGRIRGILTGLPGKLGIGALATMGVGAATGNEQVSGISDQLFQAAMLASFIPQEAMGKMKNRINASPTVQAVKGKFAASKMGGRFGVAKEAATAFKGKAAEAVATKGLLKALPMLAKGATMVGLRFLNMVPIVGQVALALEIVYTVATANARAQEEISKAIVETLTMTKDKLDKINEFFGSEAKLSGIRTATVAGAGQTGEQASLAEQFRQSEQFQTVYKESAGKLKGASKQQFAITMQSLGLDLYGQGMSEDQVQIIIDAIKKEAGQTDVVINFKDLRIDTKAGKENLINSIKTITSEASKEFKSNRDWGYINFEAQANLDEYEAQMTGFISALSQEFVKGRISAQDMNSSMNQMKLSLVKMEEANPGDGMKFLNDTLDRLNPELAKALGFVGDMKTKFDLAALAAKGIQLPQQLINDLAANPQDATANAYKNYLDQFATKKSKDLRNQQKVVSGITQQQKVLEKQEKGINDIYDKRIKALERINELQAETSRQKQNQLDLAEALTRGDVFAAAQITQKIRAEQAAFALQQQKNALEDARDKKVKGVQDAADNLDGALSSAQTKLNKIEQTQPKAYESTLKAPNLEEVYSKVGWIYKMANPLLWLSNDADVKVAMGKDLKGLAAMLGPLGQGLMKADGGYISGPGSGTSDSIPARLSNGEYVIRAKAVNALGTDVLDKMNYAEKFAKGGYASSDERRAALQRRSSSKPKPKSKGLIGNILSAFNAVTSKMGINPFDIWNPLDPTGGMASGKFVYDVATNNLPKLLSGKGNLGDAGMAAMAALAFVPGGDKVAKIGKIGTVGAKVASAAQRNAVFLSDNTPIDSARYAKLLETSMKNPDIFSNASSLPAGKADIFPAALDAFGELGLGKFGTRSVSSVEEFAQNLIEILPHRIAQTEASIMALQAAAKGARFSEARDINMALSRSGKLSNWQRVGIAPNYIMNDVSRFISGDVSVLEKTIKQLDQLRNTAHLLPDVAFKAGTEPYEAFVKTIQDISTSFDTSKFLQQGVSFQSMVQKSFKPALTNPIMAKILGSSDAQASTFFDHIYSNMGAKGIKPVGIEGKMYTDPLEQFFLSSRLFTKEGDEAGSFARGFYDNSVYHKVLALDDKFQGMGFGKDFSTMSEELYRFLGLDKIQLTAGLTKGPYTWAKAGYQWNSPPSNVTARIDAMLNDVTRTPQEVKILQDLAKRFDTPFGSKEYPTPKEIADISVLNQQGTKLGKEIFHEFAGWNAVKFIKDIPLNKEVSQKMYGILEEASKLSGIDIMDIIPKFKNGGMFRTPYADGGLAMLHDKEFVMNAGAVKDYGVNNLKAMNNGTYSSGSVYNSYGVNINVGGSNSNAGDIARTVIREIKRIDSQNIRSTKV
jgi:TP901 family phage tail tape measure protein